MNILQPPSKHEHLHYKHKMVLTALPLCGWCSVDGESPSDAPNSLIFTLVDSEGISTSSNVSGGWNVGC